MAEFLTGRPLVDKLRDIIENARDLLVIVSPYITLDEEIRYWFEKHLNNRKLHILVIFGKNPHKSIKYWDLSFFKQFPNIKIIYADNLHAKYYANETEGLVTSMNLLEYSINNNIEFGYCEKNMHYESSDECNGANCATSAFEYSLKIAKYPNNEIMFQSRYCKSWIYDLVGDSQQYHNSHKGYCIRCGCKIEFNIERPMCYDCYQSWSIYGNLDYPEKFCHYSGEKSFGNNCMGKPILSKNWNKF